MKRLILLFLTIYQLGYGQPLFVGVTTTVNLASASHMDSPQGICYKWTIAHWNNLVYATGMRLYIRIDSIIGPPNSIKITRNPDYLNTPVNVNDTIRMKQFSTDIYVYYLNPNVNLYVSLVAIGTPAINNESYYCNFSKQLATVYDGCGPIVTYFSGGNGSGDTVKNCKVNIFTGFSPVQSKFNATVFPNPASDQIFIETDTNDKKTLDLYDVNGRHVFSKITNDKSNIDVRTLNEGVYTLTIKTFNGIINKKLVVIR